MAGKTVMVVDDSRVARMMTKLMIEQSRPDWRVVECESGEAAVEAWPELRPDFTIMDVNMTGIDGLEACRRILALDPAARITVLTANIQDPIRKRAEEMGVTFMAKPVREDALMAFLGDGAP